MNQNKIQTEWIKPFAGYNQYEIVYSGVYTMPY